MTQPPNGPQNPNGPQSDPNVGRAGAPQPDPNLAQPGGPQSGPHLGHQGPPPSADPYQQPGATPYPQGAPDGGAHLAPEAEKKSNTGTIIKTVISVLVLAVGGFFMWQNYAEKAEVAEGACLVISGEQSDDVDHEVIDCDDAEQFSMTVVSVSDQAGQCDEYASEYTLTGRGADKVACLLPNFHVDNCYNESAGNTMFEKADCGGADFKVTKIEDVAEAQCAAEEFPLSFTKPPKTFCMAEGA